MQRVRKVEITTTFKALRKAGACKDRYQHLAKALGGIRKYGYRTPINLLRILEHNGINDFFRVAREVEDNPIFRLMAADFAESVLPIFERDYPDDPRPREAIETARRFFRGEATEKDLIGTAWAAWAASAAWATWAARAARAARAASAANATSAAWAASAVGAVGAVRAAWAAKAASAASADEEIKQIAIIKKYLK